MKNFVKSLLIFTGLIVFLYADLSYVTAEGPNDPAPIIYPANPNGMKVLFDNSHGQTAGQSDWVIDGAFSDFANALANEGYVVKEHRSTSPLTLVDLADYDVFVIPEAQIPFKATEQQAIVDFAEAGGGVFFISDHYNADRNLNRWDSSEIMNGWRRGAYNDPTLNMSASEISAMAGVTSSQWLSNEFGVEFRYNALDHTKANVIVPSYESFDITTGVSAVSIHAGSTLAITNPSLAKGIAYLPTGLTPTANRWNNAIDQGVYANGGIAEGPFVAISKKLNGKAAFIGDSSPVEDITPKYRNEETGALKRTYDGFIADDNATLLVNIIHWLATQESYHTLVDTTVTLDAVTPLLPMELPANSTEPAFEPWRLPTSGYLWYDQSTFAAGSYGSSISPPATLTYTLVTPTVLDTTGNPFDVTVAISGLAPNETVTGLRMQVYLSGGTAISQIQNQNGSWPSGYGYQEIGTITANHNGIATTTVRMRLNPNITETNATIRLRAADGTNLITQSVLLGTPETPVDPEPPTEETQTLTNGNYKFILPAILPANGEAFPVQVGIEQLAANTTITNAQVQFYLSNGTGISQIQNADGSWPSSYGYFNVGNLTADSSGTATKTIMMRINPTVTASTANIRLRLGSGNNVLTATIQLP
ncbi:DNA-binding protein [Metasolibacillus meyeri]|uniref:DNA-binding protein n=1 Tax=Metasolibacillus meyeri TaxID=1071052 RepID=A0AAW9NT33_9BACL|nr:DNA-binding protein [Metasolibacillus meyeri]MEC1178464.1 DNA-binding protein [Metasolibacillus meyeri]